MEISVPEHVQVDMSGIGIFGGFQDRSTRPDDPNAPTLRVTGKVLFGGVEVKVRKPSMLARLGAMLRPKSKKLPRDLD